CYAPGRSGHLAGKGGSQLAACPERRRRGGEAGEEPIARALQEWLYLVLLEALKRSAHRQRELGKVVSIHLDQAGGIHDVDHQEEGDDDMNNAMLTRDGLVVNHAKSIGDITPNGERRAVDG